MIPILTDCKAGQSVCQIAGAIPVCYLFMNVLGCDAETKEVGT